MPPALPAGRLTFLFTDIEGSTPLLRRVGDRYDDLLETHRRLIEAEVVAAGGVPVRAQGDEVFAVFEDPASAVRAAAAAQRNLLEHPWPADGLVRVRMGVHTGEARVLGGDYTGLAVHAAARVANAASGGQILVSGDTGAECTELGDLDLADRGQFRLRGFDEPVPLLEVTAPWLPPGPAPRALPAERHNLPRYRRSFVGREDTVSEVVKALDDVRLVTITGPGGVGKSRLAVEVALAMTPPPEGGTWMAELAPVTDHDGVVRAVASAVGCHLGGGADPVAALATHLDQADVLVLLDNCEHVVDAAAAVADQLLDRCAGVRLIATSREPLRIDGEAVRPLGGLPVPPAPWSDRDELFAWDAVRLFAERAALASPSFALDESTTGPVVDVVRALDGLPLAIELAAVRLDELSVLELRDALQQRFAALDRGLRTAPARQRTLRAVFDWSWEQLDDDERQVLATLGVFRGSAALADLAAVAGLPELETTAAADRLGHRSLCTVEDGRVRVLETVRAYAAERLEAEHRLAAVAEAHARHFHERATTSRAGGMAALTALRPDLDELRAAHDWGVAHDPGLALNVAYTATYLFSGVDARESRVRLEEALEAAAPDDPGRLPAVLALAMVRRNVGDYPAAIAATEEATRIAEADGDDLRVIMATELRGDIAVMLNDIEGALDRYQRADQLRQQLGKPEPGILVRLGIVHFRMGDLPAAGDAFERAIDQYRAKGDVRAEAAALNNLAGVRFDLGDVDGAIDAFRTALELVEGTGEGSPITRRNLAAAERRRGNLEAAVEWAETGLTASITIGAAHETALCTVEIAFCLAEAASPSGDAAVAGEAAVLIGGAAAICDQLGGAALENGDMVWELVADIDPDAAAHRDEGRQLAVDALVERARRAATSLSARHA